MFGGEGGTQYLLYLQPVKSRPETDKEAAKALLRWTVDRGCIARRI